MQEKELGSFENIDFSDIEDSCYSAKKILWKDKKFLTLFVIFFSVSVSVFFASFDYQLFGMGFFIILLYFFYYTNQAKALFFKNLAKKNNFQYEKTIFFSDLKGNLFKCLYIRSIKNVLVARHKGKKACLFSYVIEHNNVMSCFTVLEIFFNDISFPHTLLEYQRIPLLRQSKINQRRENEIKINLEEEFNKDYALYIKDGYGIEAMQIFSQEFLSFLMKEKSNFSIELSEDRLYIYTSKEIGKKHELQEFINTANEITERINPLLKRLKNDFKVLNEAYKN
jgi:hypothetical protein